MFQPMKRCTQITTILLLAVLFISGGGCGRFSTSSVDEEKEAHYLAGKNRLYSHDFEAAKAAFCLELNRAVGNELCPWLATALRVGLVHEEEGAPPLERREDLVLARPRGEVPVRRKEQDGR